LRELSLSVAAGEIFALVGPNGAGKTTAIGLLTGLLEPTSGSVRIAGHDLSTDAHAAKRLLGFVPDRPFLWPRWTPAETLRYVGAVFAMNRNDLERLVEAEIEAFGLTAVRDQRNETLSHGTRQRVALAQAFLHSPSVYLLDEPMVGLDPIAQRSLVNRLREKTAAGAAVLLTTHQLFLAEEVGDRAGVLVSGRLLACGDPRDLEANDRTRGRLSEVFFNLAGAPGGGEGQPFPDF
jgi:ABC-2 type transport system ATP-binding protein